MSKLGWKILCYLPGTADKILKQMQAMANVLHLHSILHTWNVLISSLSSSWLQKNIKQIPWLGKKARNFQLLLSATEPAYLDMYSTRCLRPRQLLLVGKGSISLHTPEVYLWQSISRQPLYLSPQKTEENFEVGTILLRRMIPIKEFSTHLQCPEVQVTGEEVTPPACCCLVNPMLS